jgi:alpha-amylase
MRELIIMLAIFINGKNVLGQQPEIMYHIFQRSFFDSDGDRHGDLAGIKQKLDYLQELGVTSILLTPLYQSDFYHNYFATDFEKIDPEYGSMHDYIELVKEVHRRRMKIYQDVEMQYVAGKHPWFVNSYKTPSSSFSHYLYYEDKEQQKPWYFFGVSEFTIHDNSKQQIIIVNMNDTAVKSYTQRVLEYWIDPNNDGSFDDGVDGFRLDHMMDDLDYAGRLTHLFKNFWSPLLTDLKRKNPELCIIAEQANWNSFGYQYYTEGAVDRVFAFRLGLAIASLDRQKILAAADSTLVHVPAGKQQIVFLENHDTRRIASERNQDMATLKVAAGISLLIGGVPCIYYGQELGMKGKAIKGMTDGNDIPIREAFEWYKKGDGKGMALWYKDTGPWWDSTSIKPADGISLEEERDDINSLFNYYKTMIGLRKKYEALSKGEYRAVNNSNEKVLSFTRYTTDETILVLINLSNEIQHSIIEKSIGVMNHKKLETLFGNGRVGLNNGNVEVGLDAYAIQLWRVN